MKSPFLDHPLLRFHGHTDGRTYESRVWSALPSPVCLTYLTLVSAADTWKGPNYLIVFSLFV